MSPAVYFIDQYPARFVPSNVNASGTWYPSFSSGNILHNYIIDNIYLKCNRQNPSRLSYQQEAETDENKPEPIERPAGRPRLYPTAGRRENRHHTAQVQLYRNGRPTVDGRCAGRAGTLLQGKRGLSAGRNGRDGPLPGK